MVSRRTGTPRYQDGSSSRHTRPSTTARRSCGCSSTPTRVLTTSSGWAVGAVVARAWATHRNSSSAGASPTGTHMSRSANDRSDRSCHSATTICRWSTSPPDSFVCSASRSESVDKTALLDLARGHAALLGDGPPDLVAKPLLEGLRRVLTTALAREQHLQVLFDAVVLEAGTALVEVLLQQQATLLVAFVVEE